jgi:hypothetical protein
MFLPGLILASPSLAASLAYIGSATNTADQTTYNFGNFTAPSAGIMIAGVAGRQSTAGQTRTVSSVSIGGSGATIHVNPSGGNNAAAIASRFVGSGSQAVSATFSGGVNRAACFVWFLTRFHSASPVDTDGVNATSGTSNDISLNIRPGGGALYVAMHSAPNDTVFSSADEDADLPAEVQFAAARKLSPGGAFAHVETISWSSGSPGIAAASWR